MGLYREHVLPRLVNIALDGAEHRELRGTTARDLRGEVLEIGFGSGLNLPYYPPEVTRIHVVEPSRVGRKLAARRMAACPIPVKFCIASGEEIPLTDRSVDTALSTWTLCTIPDLPGALAELRRVLRPGGRLHFCEHGLSPDARVARWQHRLNGLQKLYAGGCQLVVRIDQALREAGFEITELRNDYMKGPKVACYLYQGVAVNPV